MEAHPSTLCYEPIRNQVSADTTSTTLAIWVRNSGVEIPAVERDRIFDELYRVPSNAPWKHGGTGLGLTMVKKLAERLGATIRVNSCRRQTTFTLEFFEPSERQKQLETVRLSTRLRL